MPENTFLVGYGTLLHQGSLGNTIGQDSAGAKRIVPVVVSGYRRLFNLRPTHYESSAKFSDAGIEDAAMNVERADGAQFNALAFSVTAQELADLDERERYYSRESSELIEFGTGASLGEGHFYVGDDPYLESDPEKLMPLWRDIVWARSGAYRVGEEFGAMYDATTYLADGRTLMIDVYRDLLKDTSDVEMPG